ncbi:MAG: hypothetical protein A2474_06845 [Elusimicrobia bacterium RIFOXYC2_FULL_34_12]|nr:MAG: hypothetical protein A2474_06845 [Elusimicrobia bacterium RIFOXYC2_FULL_34_12]OGS38059.1 MAG: hypothetical protein A2551_00705 [Elusimicrobia bacterium RIFOXYD2_FULL_34_30]HAM39640.1 hypothetical protein [Elusimicrobiota bacterium]
MDSNTGRNFRKTAREGTEFDVEIFAQDQITALGSGKIIDISIEGMSMISVTTLHIGTEIFLQFVLNKEFLTIKAEVVRAEQGRVDNNYGLKFVEMPQFLKLKLEQYILQQYLKQFIIQGQKTTEKREKNRKTISILAKLYKMPEREYQGDGELVDIGTQGIALKSDVFIFVNTKVNINYKFKEKTIIISGEIIGMNSERWKRIYRIKFREIDSKDAKYIQQNIDKICAIEVEY